MVRFDPFGAITLQVVAERAAGLVPDFQRFVLACALPGDPAAALGREGHRLATEFDRLHAFAADELPVDGLEVEHECLLAALRYHRMVVHDALRLTFPKVRTERIDARRAALAEPSTMTLDLLEMPARLAQAA